MNEQDEQPELPELTIGQVVRVFRAHAAGTLWLYDPTTGQYAENGLVRGEFAVGKVRERRGDCCRVTVLRGGRQYFIDWTSRHLIRLSHEPAPTIRRW